jgi:hypothetical protein
MPDERPNAMDAKEIRAALAFPDMKPADYRVKESDTPEEIACALLNCNDWPARWNADYWSASICLALKQRDRARGLEVARILKRHIGTGGQTPDAWLMAYIKGMGINPELA